ncbi:hypothetical protein LIER_37075 [Lithospermum erythrorhizon]|uniref:Uncharacterized protein n=1 Tax=Lithospermum erythrorhizon TaxID=34254 RepID=A0AAV3PET0_LITER
MSNEKLVKKVQRTLPKMFSHKVTATKEDQDLTTMSVDELIGNLPMFEMSLDDEESSRKIGVALKATSKDVNDEDLKPVKQGKYGASQSDKSKGIQCRECVGFGHNQVESPNYIKKQSKNYSTTLNEDESEDQQEDQINNFVAFKGVTNPTIVNTVDDNSEDEKDITEEGLLGDYKLVYTKWTELSVMYIKVDVESCKIKAKNEKLRKLGMDQDEEVHNLKAQVLNLGIEMNEQHTDDGPLVNDMGSNETGKIDNGKGVEDTCDDSRPIQPASQI